MEYINLEQFEKNFTENTQGYIENFTGKIIYCPYDLGFKLDLEDCLEVGDCNEIFIEYEE
ncbi:hypothetical protein [Clostridium butyricum]|uniref:hypothetical protein n=1 Tax=Clostridium butyricum TaxID=1492 RepID=UPI002AB07052|nr:hypothetical protein [Clostridium butyricum]